MNAPEPVFEAPWHAQLFALTVHLNETGHFAWPDWAAAFSKTLAQHGLKKDLNGGDDYFAAWLETLEMVLAEQGKAAPEDVARIKQAWQEAYLHTPHGHPVHLQD
jgi:nitrile hydratase accessory protein